MYNNKNAFSEIIQKTQSDMKPPREGSVASIIYWGVWGGEEGRGAGEGGA